MSGLAVRPRDATDWLAIATACLFAIQGVDLIVNSETPMLRLAVFGWPAWTAAAFALAHLCFAALIVLPVTRLWGATGLIAVAAAVLAAHLVYREPSEAAVAAGQLLVALVVLYNAWRRAA